MAWNDSFRFLLDGHYKMLAASQLRRSVSLLSFLRLGWLGDSLRSERGFECQAQLDRTVYPTKVKLTLAERAQIDCHPHRVCPHLSYTEP